MAKQETCLSCKHWHRMPRTPVAYWKGEPVPEDQELAYLIAWHQLLWGSVQVASDTSWLEERFRELHETVKAIDDRISEIKQKPGTLTHALGKVYGQCRRFPPDYIRSGRWPITESDDFCGEYQRKTEPEEKTDG